MLYILFSSEYKNSSSAKPKSSLAIFNACPKEISLYNEFRPTCNAEYAIPYRPFSSAYTNTLLFVATIFILLPSQFISSQISPFLRGYLFEMYSFTSDKFSNDFVSFCSFNTNDLFVFSITYNL